MMFLALSVPPELSSLPLGKATHCRSLNGVKKMHASKISKRRCDSSKDFERFWYDFCGNHSFLESVFEATFVDFTAQAQEMAWARAAATAGNGDSGTQL